MTTPYNPLDKINLGKSVAEALLDSPAHPLVELPRFDGAGIYVIYYTGNFPPYLPMADVNAKCLSWPIYIGKAIPSGGRRGASLVAKQNGEALYKRLNEHRNSISAAERSFNAIQVRDFYVRHLLVDDIWIPLGENVLIEKFYPLWNGYLDGFGNHAPGKGRAAGLRPRWDTLHPGRPGFDSLPPRPEPLELIIAKVSDYLLVNEPISSGRISFATSEL